MDTDDTGEYTKGVPRLPDGFPMPERTDYVGHRCRCELIEVRMGVPTGRRDRCGAGVRDPETPVCDGCVDAGHIDLPTYRMAE